MRLTSLPSRRKVTLLNQFLQAKLQGAGYGVREFHDMAERDGFVIGHEGNEFLCEQAEGKTGSKRSPPKFLGSADF